MNQQSTTSASPTLQVVHDSFTVERTFPHPREREYRGFSDPASKYAWFGGAPEDPNTIESTFDFRPGGLEVNESHFQGAVHRAVTYYFDIVDRARIVYGYEMVVGGVKLSASLATVEFFDEDIDGVPGTRLVHTEHGAYFDGAEDPAQRREGMNWVYDTQFRGWLDSAS